MNEAKPAPAQKKTRNRRSPAERAADVVAKMDTDELKRFRVALEAKSPTNAKLLRGEKIELSLD